MKVTLSPAATLTLDEANTIASAAIVEARRLELAPICVAVLDASGVMKALQTEDRVSLMRPDVAIAKAWGSLGLGFSTRTIAGIAEAKPPLFSAFNAVAEGRLVPSPGGVLIARGDELIGAVGISGDTGPNDELCSIVAVEAAGLGATV